MARSFRPLAVAVARALDEKKAEGISLLHPGKRSPMADYLLIATALSRAHIESLEQEAFKAAADLGFACLHQARPASAQWRVLDFGGLVAHLMVAESREFYGLDKLSADAPKVEWHRPSRVAVRA